jgi:selenium-binding protein 1
MITRPAITRALGFFFAAVALLSWLGPAAADETCQSPFLPKVTGQEDYIYVWTLGIKGVGDGNDSIVTVDANPKSASYGKIINRAPVPGRHEAHHAGFTDDRRFLWAGGLDTSQIFVFDVGTNPAKPKLVKTISTFVKDTGGLVGPHTFYALPGRMLISALSNAQDGSGRTGLAEYSNDGKFIRTIWMPKEAPYGYDVRVNANLNRMLTSSFTGKKNYMRPFGELTKDAEAMKQFGGSMVVWNFHTRQPKQVFSVPGAPLEIRWAWGKKNNYAFTATALTSKLWLCFEDKKGKWQATEVASIGGEGGVLPVDISLSADDRTLFVDCFGDGKCRVFDVKNPHKPRLIHEQQIGRQLNMVSQSWDGKRLYFSSSLLAHWDKGGDDNEQFVRAYSWDGKELTPTFELDFAALELGRPHHMLFGSTKVGN